MKLATFSKQPNERESYTITYEDALTDGDNVISATALVEPAGLTIDGIVVTDPVVKFWASGGTVDTRYKVTITATTEDGRVMEDEIIFKIKEI